MFYVRVPASTANLGPGFDALGVALKLYLHVRVKHRKAGSQIEFSGEGAKSLQEKKKNLIWQVIRRVAKEEGCAPPNLFLQIRNEIPIARGLGSSAAATIAGIVIADRICNLQLSQDEILRWALKVEGHPDNVTAALLGGFVATAVSGNHIRYVKSRVSKTIKAVVVVPDFELSTSVARAVLPKMLSRSDVVFNLQRLSVLVAALREGKIEVISEAMQDRLHQPYRRDLVPGLRECLDLKSTPALPGLLGIALSGSGPTILALANENFTEIGNKIKANFRKHGISSVARVLDFDNTGIQIKM